MLKVLQLRDKPDTKTWGLDWQFCLVLIIYPDFGQVLNPLCVISLHRTFWQHLTHRVIMRFLELTSVKHWMHNIHVANSYWKHDLVMIEHCDAISQKLLPQPTFFSWHPCGWLGFWSLTTTCLVWDGEGLTDWWMIQHDGLVQPSTDLNFMIFLFPHFTDDVVSSLEINVWIAWQYILECTEKELLWVDTQKFTRQYSHGFF